MDSFIRSCFRGKSRKAVEKKRGHRGHTDAAKVGMKVTVVNDTGNAYTRFLSVSVRQERNYKVNGKVFSATSRNEAVRLEQDTRKPDFQRAIQQEIDTAYEQEMNPVITSIAEKKRVIGENMERNRLANLEKKQKWLDFCKMRESL